MTSGSRRWSASASGSSDDLFISQLHLADGDVAGVQRKRHLGEGEEGFVPHGDTARFASGGGVPFGIVICAESHVDFTWEASSAAGERLVLLLLRARPRRALHQRGDLALGLRLVGHRRASPMRSTRRSGSGCGWPWRRRLAARSTRTSRASPR